MGRNALAVASVLFSVGATIVGATALVSGTGSDRPSPEPIQAAAIALAPGTVSATPTSLAMPMAPSPSPTEDPFIEELRIFFDFYSCPQLSARQAAAEKAWQRFTESRTPAEAEGAFEAQREVLAVLDRFPRFTLARELHDLLIQSEEVFLEAILAYDRSLRPGATQPTLHLRLISESNALRRQVSDLITDLTQRYEIPPPTIRDSGTCIFLR